MTQAEPGDPEPPPNPRARPRWLRLTVVGAVLVTTLLLTYPLAANAAREFVRDTLDAEISRLIRGRLQVGSVTSLRLHRGAVVARNVRLFDADGKPVIVANKLSLGVDLRSLLSGTLRFSHATVEDATLTLRHAADDDTPSFVGALQEADSATDDDDGPTDSGGLQVVVDNVALRRVTVKGELLGLQGLRASNVSARGRIVSQPAFRIDFSNVRGTLVAPFETRGTLLEARGSFSAEDSEGLQLAATAKMHRPHASRADRLKARLAFRTPEHHHERKLDLVVHAEQMDAALLHALGFSWAEPLHGNVMGDWRLHGEPGDLSMAASLDTEGGPVSVTGTLHGDKGVAVQGRLEAVDLAKVVRGAPAVVVTATWELSLPRDDVARYSLDSEAFLWGGMAVPGLRMEGTVLADRLMIGSLQASQAGGSLRGQGWVGFDGHSTMSLRGTIPQLARDPSLRDLVPGVRGRVQLDVDVETPPLLRLDGSGAGGLDNLRVAGSMAFTSLAAGALKADRLEVTGELRGPPQLPHLTVQTTGRGVLVAGTAFSRGSLAVRGHPGRYSVALDATAPHQEVNFDGVMRMPAVGVFVVPHGHLQTRLGGMVWQGSVSDVRASHRGELAVGRIDLASEEQHVSVSGGLTAATGRGRNARIEQQRRLEARLSRVDASQLHALLGDRFPTLEGNIDGRLAVEGSLADPQLELEGVLRRGGLGGVPGIELFVTAGYGSDQFDITGQLTLGDHGAVSLSAAGQLDTHAGDIAGAFNNAVYQDARILAERVDLQALQHVLDASSARAGALGRRISERLTAARRRGDQDRSDRTLPQAANESAPAFAGHLSGEVTLNGPLQAPVVVGSVFVPDLTLSGWPTLTVAATTNYEYGSLAAQLSLADPQGPLAQLEGHLVLDLYELALHPATTIATLETLPWELSFEAPERPLGRWPEPLAARIPEPLHPVSLAWQGTARGGALRTTLTLHAGGTWHGSQDRFLCPSDSPPKVDATLRVDNGIASLHGEVRVANTPLLALEAQAQTPIDAWIASATVPAMPEVDVDVSVAEGAAARFAGLCDGVSGELAGHLAATGLFGPKPSLDITASAEQLRVGWPEPLDGTLHAALGEGRGELEGQVRWSRNRHADVHVQLPIRWGSNEQGGAFPLLRDRGEVAMVGSFREAPLAPLVAWLPWVRTQRGRVNGDFRVSGPQRSPAATGSLAIRDGYIEVTPLGQHLSEVAADLRFEPGRIVLESLHARENDGNTEARGQLLFTGLMPSSGRLQLRANNFPVRQEGSVVARLDGRATLNGDIARDETAVDVRLDQLTAMLPDATNNALQDLAPHPDIHVSNAMPARQSRPDSQYPIRFNMQTARPVHVERSDFAVDVRAALRAELIGEELSVEGSANVVGGHYEAFEKRFNIDQGRLRFDGGRRINPALSFQVSHELVGLSTTVFARIDGRLEDPRIEFSSDDPDCVEHSDVITMLVQGRCGAARSATNNSQAFARQTQDFLAGLSIGLGGGLLRQEADDVVSAFIPTVSFVDTGLTSTWRAKLDLFELLRIPESWRQVIRTAHLEGVLTDTQQQGSNQQLLGGVLELGFPYDFFLRFQFGSVGWAGDFNWEP